MAEKYVVEDEPLLTPDDAELVSLELMPAKKYSYHLGLNLNVPQSVVEEIYSTNEKDNDRLRLVVVEALHRGSSSTWRDIIDALRDPQVNLSSLANSLEAAHLPEPASSTPSSVEEPAPITPLLARLVSAVPTPVAAMSVSESAKLGSRASTVGKVQQNTRTGAGYRFRESTKRKSEVKTNISELETEFTLLRDDVRECIKKKKLPVAEVLEALTSLETDDDNYHKVFLQRNIPVLFTAVDHDQLFKHMNTHWNYLDPSLLNHLVTDLDLEEVKGRIESYKSDLQQFRRSTSLAAFCQTQPGRKLAVSRGLRKMIAKYKWPKNRSLLTLEVVEQFRQDCAAHYSLRECAMMVQKEFSSSQY